MGFPGAHNVRRRPQGLGVAKANRAQRSRSGWPLVPAKTGSSPTVPRRFLTTTSSAPNRGCSGWALGSRTAARSWSHRRESHNFRVSHQGIRLAGLLSGRRCPGVHRRTRGQSCFERTSSSRFSIMQLLLSCVWRRRFRSAPQIGVAAHPGGVRGAAPAVWAVQRKSWMPTCGLAAHDRSVPADRCSDVRGVLAIDDRPVAGDGCVQGF